MLTHDPSDSLVDDPSDSLVVAYRHGQERRAEAAAERLRGIPHRQRAMAAALRWTADRLDPTPLGRRAAGQL